MVITELCYSLGELDSAFMSLAILSPVSRGRQKVFNTLPSYRY